ncbi:MAG: hypothetical protein EBT74_00650 [Gammaproteobacteria bacterium]|nr:hypothetical protein [Gammaproteobacteria bacterium]
MTISQFLDPTWNALSSAPGEFKYTMSVVLAGMWCVIFGIYTAELTFIGYNILGHKTNEYMPFPESATNSRGWHES